MFTKIMKILTAVCFSVLAFAAISQAQPFCTPVAPDLVSWWAADGNALDSRSRNNGTLQNGATFAAGHVGQAISFDGVDDFVQLNNGLYNPFPATGFTYEVWINVSDIPPGRSRTIISNHQTGGNWWNGISLFGGSVELTLQNSSTGNTFRWGTSSTLTPNTPYHIAVVYQNQGNQATDATIYVNGIAQTIGFVGGGYSTGFAPGYNATDPLGLAIGRLHEDTPTAYFNGLIDELSFYNRVLPAAEIAAIHAAGTAGKCKPTATVAPSGQVGWWGGDGNANDVSGNNNGGTLNGGAGFAVDKVGQGFNFNGTGQFVEILDNPSNSISGEITIEAWIKPDSVSTTATILSKYDSPNSQLSYFLGMQNDELEMIVFENGSGSLRRILNTTNSNLSTTSFTHVAATFSPTGQTMTIYVNGVEAPTTVDPSSTNVASIFDSTAPVRIGAVANSGVGLLPFAGMIDEVSLYNRALSAVEITSIFNAGIAGKLKTATTPVGFAALSERPIVAGGFERKAFDASGTLALQSPEVVNTVVGDATITFPSVTTAGTTQQIPLLATLFPALPMGTHTGLFYDIATSAVFTGNPSVCFNVPAFTIAAFADLRVMHFEAGNWVDVTAAVNTFPALCTAGVTSFSPFAIVAVVPSAADVTVSGRVLSASGRGIARTSISLTDTNGNVRRVLTSTFGYYRFDDVRAGESYILSVQSKRFHFAEPSRVIIVSDNLTDEDFTASP